MAERGPKHKWYNWCDFGEHYIEEGQPHKHVYPIPDCDAYPYGPDHDGDGATACGKHYPSILKLQVAQKLVVVNSKR